MNIREKIISDYFKSWINRNQIIFNEIFDSKIIYYECYGPVYQGINTIERWFEDWNKRGRVLSWDIKQFIHERDITVVEWYFKCDYNNSVGEFDGVSIIQFNDANRIISIKEFQSKKPHYYPYNQ